MPKCNGCGKEYEPDGIDDGYCDFNCWEEKNCGQPELNEVMAIDDE